MTYAGGCARLWSWPRRKRPAKCCLIRGASAAGRSPFSSGISFECRFSLLYEGPKDLRRNPAPRRFAGWWADGSGAGSCAPARAPRLLPRSAGIRWECCPAPHSIGLTSSRLWFTGQFRRSPALHQYAVLCVSRAGHPLRQRRTRHSHRPGAAGAGHVVI